MFELVVALILSGGMHEGGRQYDILRTYVDRVGTFIGAPAAAWHVRFDIGNRALPRDLEHRELVFDSSELVA